MSRRRRPLRVSPDSVIATMRQTYMQPKYKETSWADLRGILSSAESGERAQSQGSRMNLAESWEAHSR